MALQDKVKTLVQLVFKLIDMAVKRPLLSLVVLVVGLAAFIFINIEVVHLTSTPRFCQMCHPGTTTGPLSEVHTWKQNVHAQAGVSCLDCHGRPGAVGYMRAKMGGLVDLYGELFKSQEHKMEILKKAEQPAYAAKLVPNETCLFCHSDASNQKTRAERLMSVGVNFRLLDTVKNPEFRKSKGLTDIMVDGVKPTTDVEPNHKKHIEMGLTCMDCHLGVAHAGALRNKTKMQTCFDCHDKNRSKAVPANENCVTCHRQKERVVPQKAAVYGSGETAVKFRHAPHAAAFKCTDCHTKLFPMASGKVKVTLPDHKSGKQCFACHDGKKAPGGDNCTACHGKSPAPRALDFKVKGLGVVKFNHEGHFKKYACADCHTKLYAYKQGAQKVTMDEMEKGKSCGACHNGKKTFSVAGDCVKCHKGMKPANLTIKNARGTVVGYFNHDFHTQMYACKDCHTKLFPYGGAKRVTMKEMEQGKSCGACHDGKSGFSVKGDCAKCHKK